MICTCQNCENSRVAWLPKTTRLWYCRLAGFQNCRIVGACVGATICRLARKCRQTVWSGSKKRWMRFGRNLWRRWDMMYTCQSSKNSRPRKLPKTTGLWVCRLAGSQNCRVVEACWDDNLSPGLGVSTNCMERFSKTMDAIWTKFAEALGYDVYLPKQ